MDLLHFVLLLLRLLVSKAHWMPIGLAVVLLVVTDLCVLFEGMVPGWCGSI